MKQAHKRQPPYFALLAATLVDNGFGVVAVRPKSKKPYLPRWQTASFKETDPVWVERHARLHAGDSIGIACGRNAIGVDIDERDAEKAHRIQEAAFSELGETPMIRVGEWPKRLLLYGTDDDVDTARYGAVEILGRLSQFVAFGFHPDTQRPYYWLDDTPVDTTPADLPMVRRDGLQRFLCRVSAIIGSDFPQFDTQPANDNQRSRRAASRLDQFIIRDADGLVTDGREAFLTKLTWQEYQKGYATPDELAKRVWTRFPAETDIERPKRGRGTRRWAFQDALTKAKQIIRKQPPQRFRPRLGRADHLNTYRQADYWNAERKAEHQTEAARRAMTPAALIVNRRMLDAVALSTGQCGIAVPTLIEQTKLSESSVKTARRNLRQAGLWLAERGVYVPMLVRDNLRVNAAGAGSERVQTELTPLYRSTGVPLAAGTAGNGEYPDDEPVTA